MRSYAVTHPRGSVIPSRAVGWDQLAYASQGVMTVHTSNGAWVVPAHRAIWIPSGTEHRIEMYGRVSMRTLYLTALLTRRLPRGCRAISVSPLLRELVLHAARLGVLHGTAPTEARLARVIADQLETLPAAPLQLPMPRDPRARKAAELLSHGPGEPRALEKAARIACASRRTLERLFRFETHMTLGRWRQRLRLIEALRLLAAGQAVTSVAFDVGYRSPSSFISAFRRELGTTPTKYFAGRKAWVAPGKGWRRHPDSNRGIRVLQTLALPLGYAAPKNLKGEEL